MTNRIFLALVVAIIFSAGNADAQGESNKKPWKVRLKSGLSFYEGNVDKFDFNSTNSLSRKDSTWEHGFNYQFIYSELNDVKNNVLHDFGYTIDYLPFAKISPFGGLFFYSNEFKGFKLRSSLMLGAKKQLWFTPDVSISAAIMYDQIEYGLVSSSEESQDDEELWRLSIRPKFKIPLSDNLTFKHISFYQPQINDFYRFLFQSNTSLDLKVTDHWTVGLLHAFYLNNHPPFTGINKQDQKILVNFGFTLN